MADVIQIRRDTAAAWTAANPVLAQGEMGVETDTLKFKVGNGSTAWNALSYLIDTGDYVVVGTAQTLTAPKRGAVTVDNDLSFDLSTTNNFSCTSTGAGTLTFTNLAAGQSGFILLDNSGGHTISAASSTKVSSSFLSAVSAEGVYLLSYFTNGTNVYVVASGGLE